MMRSKLTGANRGLGHTKPHIEWVRGKGYVCFNITVLTDGYWKGWDAFEVVGEGTTAAHAFMDWFNRMGSCESVT